MEYFKRLLLISMWREILQTKKDGAKSQEKEVGAFLKRYSLGPQLRGKSRQVPGACPSSMILVHWGQPPLTTDGDN